MAHEGSSSFETVVFLDVDGVLHPLKPNGLCRDASVDELSARADAEMDLPEDATASVVCGEFNAQCMANLHRCIETTGASIVLSSTWRETAPQRRAVDAQLRLHSLPSTVACTPQLGNLAGGRPAEILSWVADNQPTRWIAIDDAELMKPSHHDSRSVLSPEHVVQTDPTAGMTEADANLAIKLLAAQGAASVRCDCSCASVL